VKADSNQFNELVARCLVGECSQQERVKLRSILSDNPNLKTEYVLINMLFGKDNLDLAPTDKRYFNRISKRLEDEGLM